MRAAYNQLPGQDDHDECSRDALLAIITQMRVKSVYQPIYDLYENSLFAYEALSRGPDGSPLQQPETMFEVAHHHHLSAELDYCCRHAAVENFVARGLDGKLSINICPSVLADPGYKRGQTHQFIQKVGLNPDQVILELTEHRKSDTKNLKIAVEYYKSMGFSIAMDDLGAGYSNLRLLAELKPDYLKLDKYFVTGIRTGDVEADFVQLIVELAGKVGCRVIAEGIETADDQAFVRSQHIHFGQGYLFGKPEEYPGSMIPTSLIDNRSTDIQLSRHRGNADSTSGAIDQEKVASLSLNAIEPCMPGDTLLSQLARFQANTRLQAIPVVDRGRVVGALIRDELFEAFARPFGHSLYHKATVSKLMLNRPAIVQACDALTAASQLATSRPSHLVYCPLIVCGGERYLGMLSIRKLLEKITSIQVEHALHCNPLTGLPGNVRINSEVQERIDAAEFFVLVHFDLDNFKAFNDLYGYERGDQMIQLVARMLQELVGETGFVGHIGGDDFVMVLSESNWEVCIQHMLGVFAAQSRLLYDQHEREQGYIEAIDRQGECRRFALASLSVSAVTCTPFRFVSHLEASEVIAEIKHRSKQIDGNSLVVDRRTYMPVPVQARTILGTVDQSGR